VTETKLSLAKLGASTFTAKLPTGHSVGSVLLNATVNAESKGKITDATALLGKSSDTKKITWFKSMKGWFKDQSDLVHASVRDTTIKLTQHNDGLTGCDKQATVFCQYSLIHDAACPAGDSKCSPTHIACKVPVTYLPVGAKATEAQKGTMSVKLDFNTGKSTSMTLTAGAGDGFRAAVSKSAGGTITPTLWETPVQVTDWETQKTAVTSTVSFDWSRKVEFSVGPAASGKTFVALVASYDDKKAHVMKAVPAHNIAKGASITPLPVWQAGCADEAKKVKITGSLMFEASGLKQDEVEAATKASLAFAFDVNPSLIEVTATQARRLESDTRRLANSWTVKYALQVAESKSVAVKKAITTIQKNPADFRARLEVAVNNLPSTSGEQKTISKFSATSTSPATVPTSPATVPTSPGNPEAVVADSTTSRWLSSAVVVAVAFVGVMW
jgi:hypothetical protein